MKCEIFEEELNLINDENLKGFTRYCLNKLPDYFFKVPASNTGKYHPKQDLNDMGLIRHTKTVVHVALDLIKTNMFHINVSEDIVIMACLLHDGFKNGKINNNKTLAEHPLLISIFIREQYCNYFKDSVYKKQCNELLHIISSHMGIWNKDSDGNEILPIPVTDEEKLVHLADYMASRKYINMYDFDNNKIN